MSREEMKVMVVDPHPIVREGLRQFLEAQDACKVVAEAGDGNSALSSSDKEDHDVMLINAVLPGSDIFNTISTYKSRFANRKVVVCHVVADLSILQEFHRSGADGFIGQNARSSEYSIAVRTVMEGGCFFSGNLADSIFSISKVGQDASNAYGLTSRELEILSLLANGLCNKEIANQFELSVRTVEAHRLNIRRKTTSNTLSELVRVARSLGIAHLGGNTSEPVLAEQAAE
ncbi:MAG: response regulator transcription factor [Pseudomonadota bacterium]